MQDIPRFYKNKFTVSSLFSYLNNVKLNCFFLLLDGKLGTRSFYFTTFSIFEKVRKTEKNEENGLD